MTYLRMEMATRPSHKPGKPRVSLHECCCQYVIWNLYCQGSQVYSSSTRSSPENVSGGCQPILRVCVCVSICVYELCIPLGSPRTHGMPCDALAGPLCHLRVGPQHVSPSRSNDMTIHAQMHAAYTFTESRVWKLVS